MTSDAVVIGAGLAGLTAGLRLAEEGLKVTVLATGVGSLHLGGSTIDVLGYDGGPVESPARSLKDFVLSHPGHPYERVTPPTVAEAVEWLKTRMKWCEYVGSTEENMLLPSAAGAARPTAVAPETMAAGDLRRGAHVAIASFTVLKDLFPALVAANLERAPVDGDVAARGVLLDIDMGGEADVGALALARAFEVSEWRRDTVKALAATLEPDEDVGLPAVLGLRRAREVWSDLEESLGRRVFEIPTLPPSVPGIRAHDDLARSLKDAGGRIVMKASVTGFESDAERVTRVFADLDYRRATYDASWFVLATGGVMTGGIQMDSHRRIRETVFDLPVGGLPQGGHGFLPDYFADHPLDTAGIGVDRSMRPLRDGDVAYANLRAAGAIVSGAAPWKEKSGNGISVATGYRAAASILEEEQVR
jgi:glycerol-3-phosphate dehydrogenase subunit B